MAAAAVQGAVRRSIKIPRPGQSKAGAGAAEGGGATAGVAAAGTAAAIQPKQEAETGAKPGVPAKLERSSDVSYSRMTADVSFFCLTYVISQRARYPDADTLPSPMSLPARRT